MHSLHNSICDLPSLKRQWSNWRSKIASSRCGSIKVLAFHPCSPTFSTSSRVNSQILPHHQLTWMHYYSQNLHPQHSNEQTRAHFLQDKHCKATLDSLKTPSCHFRKIIQPFCKPLWQCIALHYKALARPDHRRRMTRLRTLDQPSKWWGPLKEFALCKSTHI